MPEHNDQLEGKSAKPSNSLIGVKLGGQYTITGVIGEGGLGTIYKAHQELVDRQVAIKFLPSALAKDQVIVKRLAREGKALGRLSHPNIVTTYDFGFTEKREPYLVLELVHGETLQAHLERLGPMPCAECLPLFIQLADAMNYAHANGVVHRDLKPHNIMLVQDRGRSTVKILDFGIAQMESEGQKLTLAGEIWGSPHYMSPEQCTAEAVDHLTDIYSLGILMYCALSNRLPHKGDNFAEVVNQKLFEPVPTFAILDLPKPIDVPLGLERVVFKCLKRKPAERYQSMEEVKLALEAFAKQSGIAEASSAANFGERRQVIHTNVKSPGGFVEKRLTRLILPAMALITVLLVAAVALLVGMALQSRMSQSSEAGSRPLSHPAQSAGEQTTSPKADENVKEQSRQQTDFSQRQAAEQTDPEQGQKELPAADQSAKTLPKAILRSHGPGLRLYQFVPGAGPSDSTPYPATDMQPRQNDPNGFYTKWGGVKDEADTKDTKEAKDTKGVNEVKEGQDSQ